MRRKKEINIFNISFLDLISGALGAVIILFITVPKNQKQESTVTKEIINCDLQEQKSLKCENELKATTDELNKINKAYTKLKLNEENRAKQEEIVSKTNFQKSESKKDKSGFQKQVGFNFKGKKIVFLIDISGSMNGDKIGQVKAGLKMLIASMDEEYHIDVVYYPHTQNQPYYSLWNLTQPLLTLNVKNEVYQFLNSLQPRGGTPTKAALNFVMRNYGNISDIVLLSDGAPGDGTKDEIISMIKMMNSEKIQINTIGVGKKNFSQTSELYQILKAISDETGGFNYGF